MSISLAFVAQRNNLRSARKSHPIAQNTHTNGQDNLTGRQLYCRVEIVVGARTQNDSTKYSSQSVNGNRPG